MEKNHLRFSTDKKYIIFAISLVFFILFLCLILIFYYQRQNSEKNEQKMGKIKQKMGKIKQNSEKIKSNSEKKIKINVEMPNVKTKQEKIKQYIECAIEIDFKNYPPEIRKLCQDALIGGKYVRPIIILSIFENLGNDNKNIQCAIDGALAIEYIHCSSLILDDMMDNDNERRGKKCIHIIANTNIAQMVSVILFMLAYQKINNSTKIIKGDKIRKKYLLKIFDKFGEATKKLGDGQLDDILATKNKASILSIIEKKTGSLFEICCVYPLLIKKAENSLVDGKNKAIKTFEKMGNQFGILFQISDDFEDYFDDMKKGSVNYVVNSGVDCAKKYYDNMCETLMRKLRENDICTKEIAEIIDYLSERVRLNYKNIIGQK